MLDSQNATEEPVLPQVARPAPARVVVLRVPAMHSAQQQAQRICATRQQNQVGMIAHQTPRPHPHLRFTQVLPQQTQICGSIFIDRERSLPIYSTVGDVIRNSGKNTTRSSMQRRALYME